MKGKLNMIKSSVYRTGGALRWNMTFNEAIDLFNAAKPNKDVRLIIVAPSSGMGKSTALEYVSKQMSLFAVEGDIMTVLGRVFHLVSEGGVSDEVLKQEIGLTARMPIGPVKSIWDLKITAEQARTALNRYLRDFNLKVTLATRFEGIMERRSVYFNIIPDYGYYVKTYKTRSEAMLAEARNRSEHDWQRHIRKQHAILSWPAFVQKVEDSLRKNKERMQRGHTVINVPNFGSTFDTCLDQAIDVFTEISSEIDGLERNVSY